MGARIEAHPALAWAAAAALLFVSGVVQGRISGRWSTNEALNLAVARLDRLPQQVGTWKGEDTKADLSEFKRAGILGGVLRRYRDERTGQFATVLLVCGRPGPISVHTPDVCYEGAGYDLAAPPTEPIPGVFGALMVRPDSPVSDSLQVFWTWSSSGRWEAPSNPRIRYATEPYLYKLYVIRPATSSDRDLAVGPGAEFTRALVATLDLGLAKGGAGPRLDAASR